MLVGSLAAAPPAGAVPLPPTQSPLVGSGFQGGDGDQADAPAGIDWATLAATGRVQHAADPNAQDDAFLSGTKENAPGTWDFASEADGVDPGQANILDAWSSVDVAGPRTFVYLAFARAGGSGTSFLTFELNRDSRLWDNGRALVPCRRDGDLLITFQPQGGALNVIVQTWTTSDADPGTGCARLGSLSGEAGVTANVDVQGALNAAAIPNSLPGSSGPSIATAQFGETALDLGAVLEDVLGTSCGAFTSFWMHSRSSTSATSNMQDYVAPKGLEARRCSAAGTKWHDLDADGVRDPGDIGLPGFRIYADLNGNGSYERGEPFAISDERGDYVIDDIRANGTYVLREEPTGATPLSGWTCSHPAAGCSWTVDAAAEPYARDRDFGNWRPGRVTLRKQLDPPGDPGRFDLSIAEFTVPAAGDGDRDTFTVRPGTYVVTETPVAGTNPADYISTVSCGPSTRRGAPRRGATATTTEVRSGEHTVCTFVNARIGSPSVTLEKTAPGFVLQGETISYELVVINTGTVAVAAGDVAVSDPQCDAAPSLTAQRDQSGAPDATPGTLDPGDAWSYGCSRATPPPDDPDDCEARAITNTGRVTVPGSDDSDSAPTMLLCPPRRQPGVSIQKVGPTSAVAGTPLTYLMYVANIGEVPFAAKDVTVSDPACDTPPEPVARFEGSGNTDASPARLDPDDVWVYRCVNTTPAPGPDCLPSVVPNTSTVVATSRRRAVDDSDTAETPLTCPPAPPDPTPEPPVPEPPVPQPPEPAEPDVTPGPAPPDAGTAGDSDLRPPRRCVRRGTRVILHGSRIASIRILAGGRRVGGLRVRALQNRAIIRVTRDLVPGRYRLTAVIRFQRGSGTPPVRLQRTVRACATQVPRFTG